MTISEAAQRERIVKSLLGSGLIVGGVITWIICGYIRPEILGISVGASIGTLVLVFFSGLIMVLTGTGLILLHNNLWGH